MIFDETGNGIPLPVAFSDCVGPASRGLPGEGENAARISRKNCFTFYR
jgi:hypothetical protein